MIKLFPTEDHEVMVWLACVLGVPSTLVLFLPENGLPEYEYLLWGLFFTFIGYVVYLFIQSMLTDS